VESLAEAPSIMTHASVPPDVRAKLGISDGLVRLSVGVEDIVDLEADVRQALDAAMAAGAGSSSGASATPGC
jgi:cystathionine gamma-lyase